MLLINGTHGIGTGYSTKVPMYNPMDVINVRVGVRVKVSPIQSTLIMIPPKFAVLTLYCRVS